MPEAVIIDAIRTPFVRKNGFFRLTRPDSLLAHALNGLLVRTGVDPAAVDDVINGTVTQAGEQGANIGRLAVLLAGFPETVPAVSLNRMCGSSQQAVHFAAQAVSAGDAQYAIGCGVESMTRAPMFSDIGGGFEKLNPALAEKVDLVHQGESAERIAAKWGITRDEMDTYAAESHRRAFEAGREKRMKEILPTCGHDAEGLPVEIDYDDGVRFPVNRDKMASLPTVFRPEGNGVVTAANASQISDGASAVLVGDRAAAEADGLRPRARFLARVAVGSDPTMQLDGVIPATQKALDRAGLSLDDIDWVEINEAFASVVLAWARHFEADLARVNPWGGAIAHGHPLGATGGGLMAKLLSGLEASGGRTGLQVMCIGHGMATATIVERIP